MRADGCAGPRRVIRPAAADLTVKGPRVYRVCMNTADHKSFRPWRATGAVLALVVSAFLAQGCATSGGAAPAPSGPVELDGTRWKLVALGGSLDGRVIQFKKRG